MEIFLFPSSFNIMSPPGAFSALHGRKQVRFNVNHIEEEA